MSDNLKPCPFCGKNSTREQTNKLQPKGYDSQIICNICHCKGPESFCFPTAKGAKYEAIKKWNNR